MTVRNGETLWTQVDVCIKKIHTHIPVSTTPTYLNTHTLHSYHPLISTMYSMGSHLHLPVLVHTCSHLLPVRPRIHGNCLQMLKELFQ